ncbi:MAG TPA: hypothetical protein PKM12_02200 [Marmoricola sp.]|nr:hypothetical protein [Marmoricola sp.]HNO39105.1 hypothetical protein [Marmoricola sp.]
MLFFALLTLLIAGVVIVYVAYPYRGEATPWKPGIGAALQRGVDSLPTLDLPPELNQVRVAQRQEADKRPVQEQQAARRSNPLVSFLRRHPISRHPVSPQG